MREFSLDTEAYQNPVDSVDYPARLVHVLRSWGYAAEYGPDQTRVGVYWVRTNAPLGKYQLAKELGRTFDSFCEFVVRTDDRSKSYADLLKAARLPEEAAKVRSDLDVSVDRIRAHSVRQFADWARQQNSGLDSETLSSLVAIYAESVERGRL